MDEKGRMVFFPSDVIKFCFDEKLIRNWGSSTTLSLKGEE